MFREYFGRTPLTYRLEDILKEALELNRFRDMRQLKEETGDLLCSLFALINECEFDIDDLIDQTSKKINRRATQYKSLGRKTTVALLGGAFNPVTNGHIQVAKFVLNSCNLFDEVWLVPCGNHMFNKKMVSPEHRLEMCKIATKSDGRIRVFDYETKHNLSGETYYFLNRLMNDEEYENYNFSYIIGMDNANGIQKWVNSEQLINLVRFVVVPRSGQNQDQNVTWYLKSPHVYLKPDESFVVGNDDISSTKARELLYNKRDLALIMNEGDLSLDKYLDPLVTDYILRHGLYKND